VLAEPPADEEPRLRLDTLEKLHLLDHGMHDTP
jgi:hypothetical protein